MSETPDEGQAAGDLDLNELVQALAVELAETREEVAGLAALVEDAPAGGPWCWRYLDREQTRQLAEELRDWVDWLIDRYHLSNIPPCWFRHGDYVEYLTALYVAWKQAYNTRTLVPHDRMIDWHLRWFRPTMEILTGSGCQQGHQDKADPVWHTNLDDFDTWLDEQDAQMGEPVSPDEMQAAAQSDPTLRRFLPDEADSPVLVQDTSWWSRTRQTPRRLTPAWSSRDRSTSRRLNHLLGQDPVDAVTGEVQPSDLSQEEWTRHATLAARGMGMLREPRAPRDAASQ